MQENEAAGNAALEQISRILRRARVESVEACTPEEYEAHKAIIHHEHDVKVLAEAVKARPDYLVTSNTDDFNSAVAARTGLRIIRPAALIQQIRL